MSIDLIDFSCKHDVMIRNQDGTMLPMDVPYYESQLIAPGTWVIHSDGDASYLVEGDNEAIVIDSGYGAGNLRQYCRTLTSKPVNCIINTHEHFDHTANNAYFDKAYMSAAAVPLATIPFKSFEGIDFPRDYPIEVVKEGDIIDLGGRTLEIFEAPDHGVGSILMLDSREHILFSGDELGDFFKKVNTTVENVLGQLKKLQARIDDISAIWSGQGKCCRKEIIADYISALEYILDGGETEPGPGLPGGGPKFFKSEDPSVTVYERFKARPCDMGIVHELGGDIRHMFVNGLLVMYDATKLR